jgi:hypothetical protein
MRFARFLLSVLVLVCSFSVSRGQADLPLYTDYLVNNFQDWGWGTRTPVNSPAFSGTNSLSLSGTAWNVAFGMHHSSFNTSPYAALSFRAHGGSTGGQILHVFAHVNGVDTAGTNIGALSANAWKQYIIPLGILNADSKTNVDQFTIQLTGNGGTGTFYLDDISLTAKAPPALVHLSLNATQAVRSADSRWFGVNTAIWDSNYDTSQTISLLNEMGTLLLRAPGGSLSDEYHWSLNKSFANSWAWVTSFANFIHVTTNVVGAQAIVCVNYGSGQGVLRGGQPQEAAAWVAYANGNASLYGTTNDLTIGVDEEGINWRTVGYWARLRSLTAASNPDNQYDFLAIGRSAPLGIKYWEIGNEIYGKNWETDFNTNAPYSDHEGWTYATRASNFFSLMKMVDPSIKIGVVLIPGEDNYQNGYTSHPATNSRTAQVHYGWTPKVLATLKQIGVTPDFGVHHVYPQYTGPESDQLLLQASVNWAADAADLRRQISDYFGPGGTNIELICTENNSNSGAQGRQSTSLVNGLYYADSLGQVMKTEFNGFVWWDLRNSTDTQGSFDPTIYGWRSYGDLGMINGPTNRHPTFYAAKMMRQFAGPGDTILNTSSDHLLVSAYAARRTNGALSLMVLNKDLTNDLTAQVVLNGFVPSSGVTVRSYGVAQDEAARTNAVYAARDVAMTNFAGGSTNFVYSFPRLSLTLLTFAPTAPTLTALGSAGSNFIFSLEGQTGSRYAVQTATNLNAPITWSTVSTQTLASPAVLMTNTVEGAAQVFWRAVWLP